MSNVKIIYSLQIHISLQNMGFKCLMEMKNPNNEKFNCWVYEGTDELLEAFDSLVKEGRNNGRK